MIISIVHSIISFFIANLNFIKKIIEKSVGIPIFLPKDNMPPIFLPEPCKNLKTNADEQSMKNM